jgi:hypothetical protein
MVSKDMEVCHEQRVGNFVEGVVELISVQYFVIRRKRLRKTAGKYR